ncbi:MAG: C_GCAxxG_C_C family protein [Acidobacteria bacterium]|nr:C_GCAxxG_C_C family protein [Acidobacteriota bacterium]
MVDSAALKAKVKELEARKWDDKALESKMLDLMEKGIQKKKLDPEELKAHKEEILDRVQLRAEEYNYFLKNCAQGTALALFEEFGIGSMEIIKALTPFPGVGGTGEICGGITGSLIAFGLFFGTDDRLNVQQTDKVIKLSQKFMAEFVGKIGHLYCADIIEHVIMGYSINPGESEQAMVRFGHDKGFEKCGLPPGIGVRLAAEFMIDSLEG